MQPTLNYVPRSKSYSYLAALILALFFIPVKVSMFGVKLALSDIASLASLGLSLLIILEGKATKLYHPFFGFILCFIAYIGLNGLLNQVPARFVITEVIQWLAILSLLSVLYAYKCFEDKLTIICFIQWLFLICLVVAAWHFIQGYQSGFKLLGTSKYAFGALCALLYIYRNHVPWFKVMMLCAFAMLILSQERKALLAFFCMVTFDQVILQKELNKRSSNLHFVLLISTFLLIALAFWSFFLYFGSEQLSELLEITREDIVFANQSEARWVSNLHRKLLLVNGTDILMNNIMLGVGAKMLPSYMINYFTYDQLAIYTHNFILDTSIEYGVIGIALLFGGYLSFILKGLKTLDKNRSTVLLSVYALIMVFFVAVNTTIILLLLIPVAMSQHSHVFQSKFTAISE